MDNLPLELYYKIFEYVDILSLFNLALVSMKFNCIIKEYKIKELIFADDRTKVGSRYISKFNWFYINQPINFNFFIDLSKLFILRCSLINLERLKFLKIDYFDCKYVIKMEDINKLNQLEQLEIKYIYLSKMPENRRSRGGLVLPKLKVLSIIAEIYSHFKFQVNTPNLESLYLDCYPLNAIILNCPLVKHLKVKNINSLKDVRFDKLEYLESISSVGLNLNILARYPNLKELRIECGNLNNLIKIMNQNSTLKVYYFGVQLLNDGNGKAFTLKF